ncbi:hypothetical protein EYF80_018721 [Liparis tanakae]|uniref:Uncharacterized protein n=1 Tax=Liparis tanakae TaxID=230148 RepID=A0A4Z2HZT4_9TELE|nr:hypothetical protein EYF80_018721 [Liparis tanakae]
MARTSLAFRQSGVRLAGCKDPGPLEVTVVPENISFQQHSVVLGSVSVCQDGDGQKTKKATGRNSERQTSTPQTANQMVTPR